VRGYRVELLEVEHALRLLDGVDGCAAVPVDDGGEMILTAVYCGDPAVRGSLARALSDRLPEFMVPSLIWHLDALPLNSNGKVDRVALADRVSCLRRGGPP
jgi:acyl-coenzyme A synthetase/AMP-(fatty) acid ligase